MTLWYELHKSIHLEGIATGNSKRIEPEDAERQTATAKAILQRLHEQPGVVLADEVGMGKTFVALAVGTSVTLADPRRRPVVVMVPKALSEKWPRDFSYFKTRCLDPETAKKVRHRSASTGVEFLKLLDDPLERRASIIFLTHGAMHRGLTDGWVKLAVIQRALHRRRNADSIRKALSVCAPRLLGLGRVSHAGPDLWNKLLGSPAKHWLAILNNAEIASEADGDDLTDDPVPRDVRKLLRKLNAQDTQEVYDALRRIPKNKTAKWKDRVDDARRVLVKTLRPIWTQCLAQIRFKLPLLVMDEAHHLKNADTDLARLFHTTDAENDAEEILRGALSGVFERMLFLTATPFQLGHHELCSVLQRFSGIDWKSSRAPAIDYKTFQGNLHELSDLLDTAQRAALNLEANWGKLRPHDLVIDGKPAATSEAWWEFVKQDVARSSIEESVVQSFDAAALDMKAAGNALKSVVVRHLRERTLKGKFKGRPRRERLSGAAILNDEASPHEQGIEVSGEALVPFLLAARATTCEPDKRPVYAEGLASSYEAFRYTQTDDDDDLATTADSESSTGSVQWYLSQLKQSLPSDLVHASAAHPKVAATAQQVLRAWRKGEKVLVFCHFLATGRTLRQVISGLLHEEIVRMAQQQIGCAPHDVDTQLAQRSGLFRRSTDEDSPARRAVNSELAKLLQEFPKLSYLRDDLQRVCRRFIRTPSFLVRYFPLKRERFDAEDIEKAFAADFGSGLSLREMLTGFFRFLADDCAGHAPADGNESDSTNDDTIDERRSYLNAILRTQTGAIHGDEAHHSYSADEKKSAATERLLPNVRLVNGPTKSETRQRLMLTFNSPFFPEVLIASSVMAEGVDLHRFCRYVIHHDLCWNPSTLEQRTGRVDRIGAKVEQCGQPIRLYLPYLGETQDEKQYRVVMDRERWFSVVMGENFRTDARSTERLADRVPLPEALARELAFRLEAADREAPATLMKK